MAMNLEQAHKVIGKAYGESSLVPKYPAEAVNLINGYYEGRVELPAEGKALQTLIMALEVLKCSCMDQSHDADVKRADRSRGQKKRKARTGSRRG